MAQRTHTYFISDLHIGAGYITDRHEHERIICRWLRDIAPTARAIYLLGDILDYWYEYRTVAPRGYVRFLGTLAEIADQGVEITWVKGNHDIWIFDYIPNEIGLTVADGVLDRIIDGHRFVMEHGDGAGEPRRLYRMMRSLFRNRFAQWLYAAIHPRWTVGFAHRWSKHSRMHGPAKLCEHLSSDDPLIVFSKNFMKTDGHVDYFIYGHRHILIDEKIGNDSRLVVLGDGFRLMTYADWDGTELTLRYIESHKRVVI